MSKNIKVEIRLKKIKEQYFRNERDTGWIMKIFERELEEMYDLGHADGYAERHYDTVDKHHWCATDRNRSCGNCTQGANHGCVNRVYQC